MARRRLPPPVAAGPALPEGDAMPMMPHPVPGLRRTAPLAQVAADSAAQAALREVAEELASARAEGRLMLALPLEAVDDGYLLRDRMTADAEEMDGLTASLRAHGQRTPIDVADLGAGRYGLISGWRRLAALRRLAAEEARFGTVLAILRRPDTAAAAYVAMVEENEIRAGLSYWERARVAARAVEAGVFPTPKAALQGLFAHASRARRSKIGSFLRLYQMLDADLRFPAAIPERLGLALVQHLETAPGQMVTLRETLAKAVPDTPEAELAALAAWLEAATAGATQASVEAPEPAAGPAQEDTPQPDVAAADPKPAVDTRRALGPGLWLERRGDGRLVLSGPALSPVLQTRLEGWLKAQLARR
jgi:ParB family transcriptional regulator, chromosome partitioning protein